MENLYIHVHVILVYVIHGNPVHSCPWEPHANLSHAHTWKTYTSIYMGILHYINHWQLFCLAFFKIFCVDFMGLSCAMYTCVSSKYMHSVPAPTAKGTCPRFICERDLDNLATLLLTTMSSCTSSIGQLYTINENRVPDLTRSSMGTLYIHLYVTLVLHHASLI
jgi:hypothetical protein